MNSDLRLGYATGANAPALAELHATTARRAYRQIFPPASAPPTSADVHADWAALLAAPDASTLVAERSSGIVGTITLRSDALVPAGARLDKFFVHPDHQGRGVGRALYDAARTEAHGQGLVRLNLWVLEANTAARAMYERWGWQLVAGPTLANDPPWIIDVLYELDLS